MPVGLLLICDITNQFCLGGGVRKANNTEMTVSGAVIKSDAAEKCNSLANVVLAEQYFFSPVQSATGNRKAQLGLSVRYVTATYTLIAPAL
jgi:hypothetical protein